MYVVYTTQCLYLLYMYNVQDVHVYTEGICSVYSDLHGYLLVWELMPDVEDVSLASIMNHVTIPPLNAIF